MPEPNGPGAERDPEAGTEPEGSEDLPSASETATVPPSERVEQLEEENEGLRRRITQLESEAEELSEQIEHRTGQLARVQADYENYRKRANREKREAARDARIEVIQVLVEVLDNVDRAKDAAGSDEGVIKGLELVEQRIHAKLEDLGVDRISPERGESFDPSRHEAMMTEASDEQAPDTVLEVLAPGYELDDRLVRAAMVKVAVQPESSDDD